MMKDDCDCVDCIAWGIDCRGGCSDYEHACVGCRESMDEIKEWQFEYDQAVGRA